MDALCCATELQGGMARSNAEMAAVGIKVRDVVLETAISSVDGVNGRSHRTSYVL